MTDKELVEILDSVGITLFELEFKGRQCIKVADILKALNVVRNELNNREKVEIDTGKE